MPDCRLPANWLLPACQLTATCLPTIYLPPDCRLAPDCRLTAASLPTDFRLTATWLLPASAWLPTDCRRLHSCPRQWFPKNRWPRRFKKKIQFSATWGFFSFGEVRGVAVPWQVGGRKGGRLLDMEGHCPQTFRHRPIRAAVGWRSSCHHLVAIQLSPYFVMSSPTPNGFLTPSDFIHDYANNFIKSGCREFLKILLFYLWP